MSINNSGRKWRRDLSPADESSKEYGIQYIHSYAMRLKEKILRNKKKNSLDISMRKYRVL